MTITDIILQNSPFLILFVGFSLSLFFLISLYKDRREKEDQMASRLLILKQGRRLSSQDESTVLINYRTRKNLDDHKHKLSLMNHLTLKIEKAGLRLSLFNFISLYLLSLSTFFILGLVVFQFSLSTSFLISGGLGGTFPFMFLTTLENRRKNVFLALFPESLDIMVRGIRSGMSVNRAIEAVAEEMKDPIKSEFRRITDELLIGQSIETALAEASYRINLDDFRFFAVALIIQRETGGNLSEALGNLSLVIRKRHEMRQKIKALSSEARASAMIVGCLPFLAALALSIMNPEHLAPLIKTVKGRSLLGVACGMMGLGALSIMRMIRFRI
jgi:tight adherence protein B